MSKSIRIKEVKYKSGLTQQKVDCWFGGLGSNPIYSPEGVNFENGVTIWNNFRLIK